MPQNFYTEIDISKLVSRPPKPNWEGEEKIFGAVLV